MAKTIEQTYQKLTDIEHCLKRPGMYIGSTNFHKTKKYLLDDNGKFDLYNVTYNPGFVQLFEEIISNSVDEHVRHGSINQIKVTIEKDHIELYDNGGIPVKIHKDHKMYVPELIFSNLKAGSNFDDDETRLVAGTHGVGATITNIFSKKFVVETADGKKSFKQTYTDNMHKRTKAVIKPSTKSYTKITFYPDFERFSMKEIDGITMDVMRKRVTDYAACNPRLKLTLNKDVYKYSKFRDYCELYVDDGVFYEESKNWKIGVGLSKEGYQHVSFVNSIETRDGGTHVDYIANQITSALREMIKKKYKLDIKPSELRNHIFLFVNSNIVNSSFNSQTKDKLITEPRNFGSEYTVTDKLIKDLFKSEMLQSVLDWLDRKKLADERREQRQLNKNLGKIKVLKLVDAKKTGNREDCILGIYEGDSALSAVRKFRDSRFIGAFPLKGKFINVSELTNTKVIKNVEVKNLMASIGLKLGEDPLNLRYGKIYIYTDADPDGDAISGALINFFAKYWPKLFDDGRVYKVMTPLVVAKNGKEKVNFYTNDDYQVWFDKQKNLKRWNIEYKKGLASLEDEEYKEIIEKPYVIKLTRDELYSDTLEAWFGHGSDRRKEKILGRPLVNKDSLF